VGGLPWENKKKKIKPHQEFNLLIQINRRDLA
jgi:hypothetical protein